jgi:hypothetical protein
MRRVPLTAPAPDGPRAPIGSIRTRPWQSRAYGREAKQAAIERTKPLAPLFDKLGRKSAREIARILIRARDRLAA